MKFKSTTQKAITVRLAISDYQKIEALAEEKNSNLAEILREAWRNYKKQNDHLRDLQQLEARLLKKIFNICCAVQGLNEQEKIEALAELKSNLRGECHD